MRTVEGTWTGAFSIGERVQLHPATDWWMRGARYGEIVARRVTTEGNKRYRVRLDVTGKVVTLPYFNVLTTEGGAR